MMRTRVHVLFALALAAVLMLGQLAIASQHRDKTKHRGQAHTAEKYAAKAERISQQLNLTEEQKAQLRPILEARWQEHRALRADQTLTREQKKERMMELRASTEAQVEQILTPEQVVQARQMRDEAIARHQERRAAGGGEKKWKKGGR
jgi:periplasmic protein CpxP/Spy